MREGVAEVYARSGIAGIGRPAGIAPISATSIPLVFATTVTATTAIKTRG